MISAIQLLRSGSLPCPNHELLKASNGQLLDDLSGYWKRFCRTILVGFAQLSAIVFHLVEVPMKNQWFAKLLSPLFALVMVFFSVVPSASARQCAYKCIDCFFIYTSVSGGALTDGTHHVGYSCADVDCPVNNCGGPETEEDTEKDIEDLVLAVAEGNVQLISELLAHPDISLNKSRSAIQVASTARCDASTRFIIAHVPLPQELLDGVTEVLEEEQRVQFGLAMVPLIGLILTGSAISLIRNKRP